MASAGHSSPSSSFSDCCNDLPVIATDDLGMIVDENAAPARKKRKQQDVKVIRKQREPRKYVSKHFTQAKSSTKKLAERKKVKVEESSEDVHDTRSPVEETVTASPASEMPQPQPQSHAAPRILYGLNIDALSSDSELSDVPSDIGPDPFLAADASNPAFQVKKKAKGKGKGRANPTKSPYFPNTIHRHRQHFLATLPFPALHHPRFGLMQERLAHDPFRLLVATIFLNKTPGERAMPIFFDLMKRYPTPRALSDARVEDVTEIIRTLGFQNQRARKCVAMAKVWVDAPPCEGKRYRKLNYPGKGDGRDVKEGEIIDGDDERVAWEISHLPGLGPYSHDSWRMFCRDELRGLATDWLGKGADRGESEEFEPEWKRVLPMDKELRAWMTWMWLKEGWVWNKETGERTKADEELLRLAREGGVVQESKDMDHLVVKGIEQESVLDKAILEKPAGDFLPG